jgi:Putative lumazine-binding
MRCHSSPVLVASCLLAGLATQLAYAGEPAASKERSPCTTSELAALSAEDQVRCVLQGYIDATASADSQRARSLFHEGAIMSGDLGNGARTGSLESFFKALDGAASRPDEAGYSAQISSINVMGQTATGEVIEKNLFGYDFIDRFHLIRLNDRWQIVSKLFFSSGPAEQGGKAEAKP